MLFEVWVSVKVSNEFSFMLKLIFFFYTGCCHTSPPWQTGCVPLQVPLSRQVLSAEPVRLYPASQLKRSKLLVLNSSPPRRAPWGGTPGSPQIPGLTPTVIEETLVNAQDTQLEPHTCTPLRQPTQSWPHEKDIQTHMHCRAQRTQHSSCKTTTAFKWCPLSS